MNAEPYIDPPDDDLDCNCIQTDVDEWDARGCPVHGGSIPTFAIEEEAAELAAYYAVDPDLSSRKPVRNAQVAEPLRSIINSIGRTR